MSSVCIPRTLRRCWVVALAWSLGWGCLADRSWAQPAAPTEPATTTPAASPKELLRQAYAGTQTAATEGELNGLVDQCREAMKGTLDERDAAYAKSLLAWILNRRGEIYAAAGKEVEALNDFEEAIHLDANRWQALHNRAVSYGMAQKFDAAVADLNRVIQLNPKYAKAYYNRGEVRFKLGQLNEALADYNQAVQLAPSDAVAYNARGFAYYSQGNYRQATRDYSQALQLDNRLVEAYVNRGDAYADQGVFSQAVRDYQQALAVDPNFGRAYQSSAWLRATCPSAQYRNTELALKNAQKAIEIDGEADFRYLDTLAAAQANAGQFDAAKASLAKALAAAQEQGVGKALLDRLEVRKQQYDANRPYRDVRPGTPQPD